MSRGDVRSFSMLSKKGGGSLVICALECNPLLMRKIKGYLNVCNMGAGEGDRTLLSFDPKHQENIVARAFNDYSWEEEGEEKRGCRDMSV